MSHRHKKDTSRRTAPLATLLLICMLGILPVATSALPHILSADGSEATDLETGLIWRRCSESMNWDGSTCAGVVGTFTYEAALRQAVAQAGSSGIARYVNFVNGVVNYYFRLHSVHVRLVHTSQ